MSGAAVSILRKGASAYMNSTKAIVVSEKENIVSKTTPEESVVVQEAALEENNQIPQPNVEQTKSKRHIKAKQNTKMALQEVVDEQPNEIAETPQDTQSNEEIVEAVPKKHRKPKKQLNNANTDTDMTETNEIPENSIPSEKKAKRKTQRRTKGQ